MHFQNEVRVKKYRPAGRPNDIRKKQSVVSLMPEEEPEPRVSIESFVSKESQQEESLEESLSQQVSYRDNIMDKNTLNLRRGTAFPGKFHIYIVYLSPLGQIKAQLATMQEEDDTYIESDSEMVQPKLREPMVTGFKY